MSDPTTNLFGQMYEQVVEVLGRRRSKNIQLVKPQVNWTWAPPPAGFIHPETYKIFGQMPIWSAIGRPGGYDFHHAYLEVLSYWNYFAKEDQIKEAEVQVSDARKKLIADQQKADTGYVEYKKSLPPGTAGKSYEEWISEFWQETLDADNAEYVKAQKALAVMIEKKNKGLKEAIEAATAPEDPKDSKPGFVKVQIGETIEVRPNYIFPDPKEWADRVAAEGGEESLSFQLSASVSSSALEKSWAGESTGLEKGFFAVCNSGVWQRMDLAAEDTTVKVNITVKAYNVLEVEPDPSWYASGLLSILALEDTWSPPFSTKGGDGKRPVFGKGGVLSLVLTGVIVGIRPSIEITMSDSTYSKYKKIWDDSSGIRVGTFQFGGSGDHTEEKWSKNSDSKQFHAESNADYPFIMGITVASLLE